MSDKLQGKIQTVLGPIAPADAGVTLAHEHLSIDGGALLVESREGLPCPDLCDAPIDQHLLWWINQHPYSSIANSKHYEERDAVREEMKFFKSNGGGTIVENTTIGIKPDAQFYKQLSIDTGVHIVAGTGFYLQSSRPETVNMSEEEMAKVMTTDIVQGINGSEVKAGVIGEVGCSWPLLDSEKTALRASAHVEAELGCPVIIHPGRTSEAPDEIVRIFREAGGSMERLVMSHIDRTFPFIPDLLEFAKEGCYIDYDLFGIETSNYQLAPDYDMPSDAQRIQRIRALIEDGYGDRVTIGQDIHTRHRLMKYGGHGYSHILLHVVPKMLQRKITQASVDKILKENPQRWLSFK